LHYIPGRNKGVDRKIFRVGGAIENHNREIVPISLPPFYQWQVRERIGHASKVHLKEMLHQEPREKVKTFLGEIPYPGPHWVLITPLLNVNQRSKELR